MRNRVKIVNTKFNVDAENKVVVCELECDLQLEKHPAWMMINPSMWEKKFPDIGFDGEYTVKAKARCNNIDTFDEKKGKMIAESRAKAKMFSVASRVWKSCAEALHIAAAKCVFTSNACSEAENIEENHVKELAV